MDQSIRITVVIPCRETETSEITLDFLSRQIYRGFKTVVIKDKGKGANWARNEGFKQADTEFVLFSDNDIEWKPNALEKMITILDKFSKPAYAYGRYDLGGRIWSHQPWWPDLLRDHNYISTMSLWRTKEFPGFDESLLRLQDWDVYLTALEQGKRGIYCEELIFSTKIRPGITFDNALNPGTTYMEAERIVKKKHGLSEFNKPLR